MKLQKTIEMLGECSWCGQEVEIFNHSECPAFDKQGIIEPLKAQAKPATSSMYDLCEDMRRKRSRGRSAWGK